MELFSGKLVVQKTEALEPNDKKAADIFARLGYNLCDAVADLVDNSVDAGADAVLVRFVRSHGGIHSVLIVDNGKGMDSNALRDAMRFGSDGNTNQKHLGKYGIGLKSASLSQADIVTVLSKRHGQISARRWTVENIRDRWKCEVLDDTGTKPFFDASYGSLKLGQSGTIVLWERLEHLRALPQNLDKVLAKTINDLSIELGVRFHRFIEDCRLRIEIDQQFVGEGEPEISRQVTPLNPFSYPASGDKRFPLTLTLHVGKVPIRLKCHIWPAKSTQPGYRLGGGKVALRQGFYFYRNDRIIQGGGWNGLRADDGEPHLSLARVEVNLPPALDSMFKLDVAKSHLDPPPEFFQSLQVAAFKGVTFAQYLETAQSVYRKQKKKDGAKFPLVPGIGFSMVARKAIAQILNEKGAQRPQKVAFAWKLLDHDEIFRVDRERTAILLNTRFRKHLTGAAGNDAPVLKLVIMFLLQDELLKSFETKTTADWLQRVNHALIASLKGC